MDKVRPWVGVHTAFRAARVEKKIMKIPKNELGVQALARSEAIVARGLRLERIWQSTSQGKKLNAGKTVLPTELFNVVRCKSRAKAVASFGLQN